MHYFTQINDAQDPLLLPSVKLQRAKALVEPAVFDFLQNYRLDTVNVRDWQGLVRNKSQIAQAGNSVNYLSCFERTLLISQELLRREIPHQLVLSSIKRFLQAPKPGTAIQFVSEGQHFTLTSANSGERVSSKLVSTASKAVNGICYAVPHIDPDKSFLDFFKDSDGNLPEMLGNDPTRKFNSIFRKLVARSGDAELFRKYMSKRANVLDFKEHSLGIALPN